jgi:hypothetical protein
MVPTQRNRTVFAAALLIRNVNDHWIDPIKQFPVSMHPHDATASAMCLAGKHATPPFRQSCSQTKKARQWRAFSG